MQVLRRTDFLFLTYDFIPRIVMLLDDEMRGWGMVVVVDDRRAY